VEHGFGLVFEVISQKLAMKNQLIVASLTLLLCSCFPVKSVQDISGYHILEGKKLEKNHKSLNTFAFQIYKDHGVFLDYLRSRYRDTPGFTPNYFQVEIEKVPFSIRVLSTKEANKYVDLTDFIFKKEDPELLKNGKKKQFVFMVVTDENGEDALDTSSFFRYIVAKYLDDIRMGFKAY